MLLRLIVFCLPVLGAVITVAPGSAHASCNCDDEVESLCVTFGRPPDAGATDGGTTGDRCCEVCLGEGAAACEVCDSVGHDGGPSDASPPADASESCGGCASSGVPGLGRALLILTAFALSRRRYPRRH